MSLDFDNWWAETGAALCMQWTDFDHDNLEKSKSLLKEAYDAGYEVGYRDC